MKYPLSLRRTSLLCTLLFTSISQSHSVTAEISCGELVDKITILTIKTRRISNPDKLKNVHTELESLQDTYAKILLLECNDITLLEQELLRVNEILWNIEDEIRIKERNKEFDDEFIELARSVYITNDMRCAIKKRIDMLLGSHITEEKSYEEIV